MMNKKTTYWALDLFGICLFFLIAQACKKKDNPNENYADKPLVYVEYAGKSVQIDAGAGTIAKPIIISSEVFDNQIMYQFEGAQKENGKLVFTGMTISNLIAYVKKDALTLFFKWQSSSTKIQELTCNNTRANISSAGTAEQPLILEDFDFDKASCAAKLEYELNAAKVILTQHANDQNLYSFVVKSSTGTEKTYFLRYAKKEIVKLNSLIYKANSGDTKIDITYNHAPTFFLADVLNIYYCQDNNNGFDIGKVYYTLSDNPNKEIQAKLTQASYPTLYNLDIQGLTTSGIYQVFYHNLKNPMNLTKLYYKTGAGASAQKIDIDLSQGNGTQANPYTLKSPSFTYTCNPKPCTTGFLYAELSNPTTPPSTWINENNIINQKNNLYELKIPYGYKDKDYLTESYYLKWEKTP